MTPPLENAQAAITREVPVGGIEQVRMELVRLEARVAEDRKALAKAELDLADRRESLDRSTRVADGLRDAVQQWDKLHAGQGELT